MRKVLSLFLVLALVAACTHRESAATSNRSAATSFAAPAPAARPRPLADGAYRAELQLAQPAPGQTAAAGATLKFSIHIRNTGTGVYPARPSAAGLRDAVFLSYHIFNARDHAPLLFDGVRAALPADLPAGASVDLAIPVKLPAKPGDYLIVFDLVHEDILWFASRQSPTLSVPERAI